jgi:peptide-methionine (S)-S-oxide reductase
MSLMFGGKTMATNAISYIQMETMKQDTITLGAGCFWCVEAIFQELDGVSEVVSGYAGGEVENPNYKSVCSGETGHAEVCQLIFSPDVISFAEILEVFWQVHDPTTLNRQGADIGTQYRSAIFYHSDEQREIASNLKRSLNSEQIWPNPIVTEIAPLKNFYPAEKYHQNYFDENSNESYCRMVINPKLEKFRKVFREKLK